MTLISKELDELVTKLWESKAQEREIALFIQNMNQCIANMNRQIMACEEDMEELQIEILKRMRHLERAYVEKDMLALADTLEYEWKPLLLEYEGV